MFYNSAKGGVDNFDGMCAESSVSRMTNRWPLCIFYGLINIVMNNAFIIYRSRQENRHPEKYDFLQTVAYHLARPHAIVHYQAGHQYLPKEIREPLKNFFNLERDVAGPAQPDAGVLPMGILKTDLRKRCHFCTRQVTRSGKLKCSGCMKSVCNDHSAVVCDDCASIHWS